MSGRRLRSSRAFVGGCGDVSSPLRYCVLLLTGDEEPFSFGNQEFLSFASTNAKEVVRFAYVYKRLQQPLCDVLMRKLDGAQSPTQVQLVFESRSCGMNPARGVYSPARFPQVVILERRNAAGKTFFKPVTAWNGSEEDKRRLLDELERLQKDPSILSHDAILPELNNEFASVRILLQFQQSLQHRRCLCTHGCREYSLYRCL